MIVSAMYSRFPSPYKGGPSGDSSRMRLESAHKKRRWCHANRKAKVKKRSARAQIGGLSIEPYFAEDWRRKYPHARRIEKARANVGQDCILQADF